MHLQGSGISTFIPQYNEIDPQTQQEVPQPVTQSNEVDEKLCSQTTDLSTLEQIVDDIKNATKLFWNSETQPIEGTEYLKMVKVKDKTFFGIHKDHQSKMDYKFAREVILKELGLLSNATVYQVIGDSAKYQKAGTVFARECLHRHLLASKLIPGLILWGFTGQGTATEERDANQLVNNWVDQNQNQAGHRSLANVVDFSSIQALTIWKNQGSLANQNFFLVYGNAKFGDDVISSDFITDTGICLEGGIQSFRQIVNLLSREKKIHGCYNLRGDKHPASFDHTTQTYIRYFSAAEFLDHLKKYLHEMKTAGQQPSAELVEEFRKSYMEDHMLFKFNPNKNDPETKIALFNAGWEQFMKEELWNRLDLCDFKKFVPDQNIS